MVLTGVFLVSWVGLDLIVAKTIVSSNLVFLILVDWEDLVEDVMVG